MESTTTTTTEIPRLEGAYPCKFAGCNYAGRNQGALNLHTKKHTRLAAKAASKPTTGDVSPLKPVEVIGSAEVITPTTRVFYSPKALSMVITVKPEYWGVKSTPAGDIRTKVEGKYVQFERGRFATEDPEIIDYIEKTYRDPRFPILSDRQVALKKESI